MAEKPKQRAKHNLPRGEKWQGMPKNPIQGEPVFNHLTGIYEPPKPKRGRPKPSEKPPLPSYGPEKKSRPRTEPKATKKGPPLPITIKDKEGHSIEIKLTPTQKQFADLVMSGYAPSMAYKLSHNPPETMSPISISGASTRLMHMEKMHNYMAHTIREEEGRLKIQQATRGARVLDALEDMLRNAEKDQTKLRAAELLGKTLGLFNPKSEDKEKPGTTIAELEDQLRQRLGFLKDVTPPDKS